MARWKWNSLDSLNKKEILDSSSEIPLWQGLHQFPLAFITKCPSSFQNFLRSISTLNDENTIKWTTNKQESQKDQKSLFIYATLSILVKDAITTEKSSGTRYIS